MRRSEFPPIIGYAYVQTKGENEILLVAEFSNNVEIRAKAKVTEGIIATTTAAARLGKNEYVEALGYARILEDGTVECQGQTAKSTFLYNALAHRVP